MLPRRIHWDSPDLQIEGSIVPACHLSFAAAAAAVKSSAFWIHGSMGFHGISWEHKNQLKPGYFYLFLPSNRIGVSYMAVCQNQ